MSLAATALAVTLTITCTSDSDSELGFARVLFWGCLLTIVTAVGILVHALRTDLCGRAFAWRHGLFGTLYCAGIAAAVPLACPPELRVQFDESSIVSTSHNIWAHGAAMVTAAALPIAGEAQGVEMTVDKRPPLLATLAAGLHGIRGYSTTHANWINVAVLFAGMTALFWFVQRRLGLAAALCAPWCLLAAPLTPIAATSAGLETSSTVALMFLIAACRHFVTSPSPTTIRVAIAVALAYSWTRYEAMPLAIVLVALSWWLARHRASSTSGTWALLLWSAALLLPLILLLAHSQEAKFYPESDSGPRLGIAHFVKHAPELAAQLFQLSADNLYPGPWVCLIGASTSVLVWRRGSAHREDLVPLVGVALPTVIALAWFYGDASEPSAARLFLPITWLCALSPLLLFGVTPRRAHPLLAMAIVMFGGARLVDAARLAPTLQPPIRNVLRDVEQSIEHQPFASATTLYVGAPAQHLIACGFAAVSPATFLRRRVDIARLADTGDLRQVVLFETDIDDLLSPNSGRARDLLQMYLWDPLGSRGNGAVAAYRLRP